MFVLNPGGSGNTGGSNTNLKVVWNFAQLGLYFCVLRGIFLFFDARESNNNNSDTSRSLEPK
jgi:hypothetical protein